jgi:hypothetical protein
LVTEAKPRKPRLAAVPDLPELTLAQRLEDADFVDRVWDYLLQQWPMRLQDIPPTEVEDVKQLIRQAERGERPYITPAGATQRARRAEQILALFNGRNAVEVARELRCGRATVYRVLKQAGRG